MRPLLLLAIVLPALVIGGVIGFWLLSQANRPQNPVGDTDFPITEVAIWSLAVSPDGKTLAAGGAFHMLQAEIHVIDTSTGKTRFRLQGHRDAVLCVVIGKDGKTMASGSNDGEVILWNLEDGRIIGSLPGHKGYPVALALSPDGETMASGGGDGLVKLWSLKTRELKCTLVHSAHAVQALVFYPDGKTLCSTGSDGLIRIWDLGTEEEKEVLVASKRRLRSLVLSRHGTVLASGGDDRIIRSYSAATWKEVSTMEGHEEYIQSLAFSPVEDALASGNWDDTIRIWDPESGEERMRIVNRDTSTYVGHGGGGSVYALAYSPDGRKLYTSGCSIYKGKLPRAKGTINVWDPATGQWVASWHFEFGPP